MVKVFNTKVKNWCQAYQLLDHLHRTFKGYQANFDLKEKTFHYRNIVLAYQPAKKE